MIWIAIILIALIYCVDKTWHKIDQPEFYIQNVAKQRELGMGYVEFIYSNPFKTFVAAFYLMRLNNRDDAPFGDGAIVTLLFNLTALKVIIENIQSEKEN